VYAALEHDPQHVPALLLAAALAGRAGDDSESLALYHRALKRDPHNAAARLGIAGVHVRHDRPARAAQLLRSVGQDAHVCEADRARAFRELAEVLSRQQRWAAAAEALESVVRLERQAVADDWLRLADARERAGDAGGARQAVAHASAPAAEHGGALELEAGLQDRQVHSGGPILQAGHTTEH
jgi:tetratricopeptide (TPR) repeat protein